MKRGYDRTRRVADSIQKAVAQLLLLETSDERFKLVTVVDVVVTRDLSYAKIFVSILLDEAAAIKETVLALNRLAKSFRYQLAKMVKLRIVPELKFIYDESTARGFKIDSLIDAAMKKEPPEES